MKQTGRRTAREEQTRADILQATRRLVVNYGLHKVTLEDIASALGKRKGFLYYYYPGRTEIIRAVVNLEFAEMRSQVRDAVAAEKTAPQRLRVYVKGRLHAALARVATYGTPTIMSALQGAEPGTDFASLLEIRRSFDEQENEFLRELLRQGIREGAFRPMSLKVIDDVARFLLSAMGGIELELILNREPRVADPDINRVLDIFLRGLAV